MQLSGKQVFKADLSGVWTLLLDPVTLARIVPGITKLERTGDQSFKSIFEIKLGPVSGSFTGNLQLEDIVEQKAFTLKVQQNSKIGNANAVIIVNVSPIGDKETELAFEGDAKLSGLLASMGQRLIGSVANNLIKQFFINMEKELVKAGNA